MLRLVGFLVMFTVGLGGILLLDFNTARQAAAAADDGNVLTFGEYLGGIPDRIAIATASVGGNGLPRALADMLPPAPEGWTLRAATKEDIAGFLPKKGVKADQKARDQVAAVGSSRVARADTVLNLTYEKGDRRVTIQAIRYPGEVFTDLRAADLRFDLRMQGADRRGRPFLTVRGLDVTEEFLGDGIRARYFFASVGGQIQLRVLATKRMKDEELLPFFETLHVQAMNASVVDKVEGLGEVPVVLLVSAMKKADREAYEADRSDHAAEAVALARALRQADADAARAGADKSGPTMAEGAAAKPAAGFAADCAKGTSGIKRCSVGAGD